MEFTPEDIKSNKEIPKPKQGFGEKVDSFIKRTFHYILLACEYILVIGMSITSIKYVFWGFVSEDLMFQNDVRDAVKFIHENWIGALFVPLILFSRTFMNKFAQIRKARDIEIEDKPTQWEVK